MSSEAWKPHVISQGEYLSKLAFSRGFAADDVWNDPRNADLKKLRGNRDVLSPGDVVWIPVDTPTPGLKLASQQTNRYRATVPRVKVDLVLNGRDGKPLAGKSFTAHGLGGPLNGTTDGAGKVSLSVPVHVKEVRLVLDDGPEYRVGVGHMDPIEERSGVIKRLSHLGFFTIFNTDEDEDEMRLHMAIADFQKSQGMPATGELDDKTKAALVSAHGS